VDEFQSIAKLFRPLTFGAPEALNLMDDAAAIPSRPGFDLIVTQDAVVEGVHFLAEDPPQFVAKKLLRVNLSDLAAKAAEPYGYFLAVAWPAVWDEARRSAFTSGLGEDQTTFGLKLFGGDTVSTPGPLTLSVTMLGYAPSGGMVKRSGAKAGDLILVSGTIGDGWLGLSAAGNTLGGMPEDALVYLADRYRLPKPRLSLRETLRRYASAAADVSDGLLADAGHIGAASGLGVEIDLDRTPISGAAAAWLEGRSDRAGGLIRLATGGDDYEIVCTLDPSAAAAAQSEAKAAGITLTAIGRMSPTPGLKAFFEGRQVDVPTLGWSHP
jgi:thiamine-monophosphate kinase